MWLDYPIVYIYMYVGLIFLLLLFGGILILPILSGMGVAQWVSLCLMLIIYQSTIHRSVILCLKKKITPKIWARFWAGKSQKISSTIIYYSYVITDNISGLLGYLCFHKRMNILREMKMNSCFLCLTMKYSLTGKIREKCYIQQLNIYLNYT